MSFRATHLVPGVDRLSTWTWHTRQGSLTRLTPPFWPMNPLKQASHLADGTSLIGLPAGLKWVAKHELSGYIKGRQFTDTCINAPFKSLATWTHTHEFDDHPQGCLVTDTVETRLPAPVLTSAFAYRQHQLIEDLHAHRRFAAISNRCLTVAMTGTHGLVGRALKAQLTTLGHTVIDLVRCPDGRDDGLGDRQRQWDPNDPAHDLLDGVDGLIHLAGEPIFGRFNDAHKKALYESRVGPTMKLARIVADSPTCEVLVCASAIGYYGASRGAEKLSEESPAGEGFLASVCQDWEQACAPARDAGKRVVNVRTGVVLSGAGGMLPVLKTLFSTGLGGAFAGQNPWLSWIAHDDLCDIYVRSLIDQAIAGPVNATAPKPELNSDMVKELGDLLRRPTKLPIPTIGPKLLLGKEGAAELALADQRVLPVALGKMGHHFRYPDLRSCLAHELGAEDLVGVPPPNTPAGEIRPGKPHLRA